MIYCFSLYASKLNAFGFGTVGWTKQTVMVDNIVDRTINQERLVVDENHHP